MATRSFTDSEGVYWLIWRVTPGQHTERAYRTDTLPEELEGGWLCFECDGEKRRMYPVPAEWESLPDDKLELLCRAGVRVNRRKGERGVLDLDRHPDAG